MGIHDGHRARKKDQYRRAGLRGMADHEVLELLLYYAIPRRDTNELAHRLVQTFGSLEAVLSAPIESLARVEGMGEHSAMLLRLVHDTQSYMATRPKKNVRLHSPDACGQYAMKLLSGQRKEQMYQLCVDHKGKLVGEYLLADGTVDSAFVNVQKVVHNALACGCVNVILAHNHPGGVAIPSRPDLDTTLHLRDVLEGVHIHLIEHIVVADGDYISMYATESYRKYLGDAPCPIFVL